MNNSNQILKIHPETFSANIFSRRPFRMVGLIDVSIEYSYGIEVVTLAFYSSSGTNNGKIKKLWYPIVGIKTKTGEFTEFTDYINFVLTKTTSQGVAKKGWLAKSLFFYRANLNDNSKIAGFSNGRHYESLLDIGKTLRKLYKKEAFTHIESLDGKSINSILMSNMIYPGNKHTQRENFERFVEDILYQV